MKVKLEYIWLDGYKPEPNLRSKVKIVDAPDMHNVRYPNWGFDGSSTMQAEGHSSDCYLKPVRFYKDLSTESSSLPTIYVLCEVLDKNSEPHESNQRSLLGEEDSDFWVGFEQEYFIKNSRHGTVIGFDRPKVEIDPQGIYYCGVGGHVLGRGVSEEHLQECLNVGITVEGTNAEVALGQWEYQIFSKGNIKAGDDLWMSRYLLHKVAERRGYYIEFHPKPIVTGEWNGSGLHTNFSNKEMREVGGKEYFDRIFEIFESRKDSHIENYGSDNHLRLTGNFETQSIDKFTWGISDRGASIRIPKSVGEEWKGYLEDRRPAANADPYKIMQEIQTSLLIAKEFLYQYL
jgi:glutamine synthetase